MKAIHVLCLVLALLLLAAGPALASDGVEFPREVLGGGASDSAAGDISLRATRGQPAAGVVTGGGHVSLGQGFWHGGRWFRVYVPLVQRHSP